MRKRDSFKDNSDVDYNDDDYKDIGKVREMKIGQEDVETRIDEEDETEDNSEDEEKGQFKENNDVDYNDDEYEDVGTVRKMKIGQEDEENED